ncbi:PA3496 family putative envelope integrity protein [Pseudomonas indica]|uniref:PA3496 family putative envelope integrity protein n=1 Tax=Pseudomonas indica TaxID=137658 RepID=UPI0023F6D73A|nr:transcriptional regulator [Pseudomonas indica]MBU3059608.1 transcriptional regulator [Pseudomonas indica]
MSRHHDTHQDDHGLDSKARRKLADQRRMRFRRAIETYAEQRQLQQELSDYPELIAVNYLLSSQAVSRRSARPAH